MEILEKTYDRACCEVEDILSNQSLSKQDVELLGELIDIIKDVEMIYDYKDKMDMGYSQTGGMRRMYNRGSSYGRNDGYSRTSNKDEMLNRLHNVMDMAMDEKDRKAVSRLIQQMEERD